MNEPIDPRLLNHPMYSASDLRYLRGKGYSDEEVLTFWSRDASDGREPVQHPEYELEQLLVHLLGLALDAIDEDACDSPALQGLDADNLQRVLGIDEVRSFDGRDAGLEIEFEDGRLFRLSIQRVFDRR